ncbi:MAG TPA: hypothetical protein VFS32_11390 [Candidatus Limnocylindrales bacterium]|nr:hypothetical protein [Candidatus Limnocylindrales bacterium]
MHPLVAYDLAKLRIAEAHQLAERERRLRIADDLDDATARVRFPGRTSFPGGGIRPVLPGLSADGLSR